VVAADPGGHLALATWLSALWRGQSCLWWSIDTPDARARLDNQRVSWAEGPTPRAPVVYLRNVGAAVRMLRRERPDLVLTTGAGLGLAAVTAARLLRIPSVFVEVVDRVEAPSLSGRGMARLADVVVVQRRAQLMAYPGARVVGELRPAADVPTTQRRGVYVSVGTHHAPMNRLIGAAERLASLGHEVTVQHGHSRPARGCRSRAFLPPGEHRRQLASAQVVVLHGGSSSLAEAASLGQRPVVVPRDPALGEHVDSHQLVAARRLPEGVACFDLEQLPELVARRMQEPAPSPVAADPRPVHRLRVICESVCGQVPFR
jgi:UDP-N-acetylglucosamine:LPS N-acetylglucosamine transferase